MIFTELTIQEEANLSGGDASVAISQTSSATASADGDTAVIIDGNYNSVTANRTATAISYNTLSFRDIVNED
ncbi:MAG: hypothetical protein ACRC2R_24340 [Xenococcaceae cyanobacterium]